MKWSRISIAFLYFLLVLLSLYVLDLRRTVRNLSIELDRTNERIQDVREEFADELMAEQEYVSHELFVMDELVHAYTRGMFKEW